MTRSESRGRGGLCMSEDKKQERVALRRRRVAPPPKERFEILVEELHSEFNAVAEGQAALTERFDGHERRQEERDRRTDKRFDDLQQFVLGVAADLNLKMDDGHAKLGAKIDGVARDLAEHRADTERHSGQYKVSER